MIRERATSKRKSKTTKSADTARYKSRSVRAGGRNKLRNFISPMLATLHDSAFDDENWIYEIKWDGYRAIAEKHGDEVRLYSRNGLSFLDMYPPIASAIEDLPDNTIVDGEIVVINKNNKADFQKLQQYGEDPKANIVFYVFDCLEYKGKDLTSLPLIERKKYLEKAVKQNKRIHYSEHISGEGKLFFKKAAELDLEGIIAKRADSLYVKGKRSKDWLKIKHHNTQEAIIAGYTSPRGSRTHMGALILAIRDKGNLRYIGHTGTGFTNSILKELAAKFKPLIRSTSPFNHKIPVKAGVTWLEPELVCNVKFTEKTADGILRHPVFQGLRVDKTSQEIKHLEIPEASQTTKTSTSKNKEIIQINGQELIISNKNKLYWPNENISKAAVLEYYNSIHKLILPHLKDRPQSLRRNPNGILDDGFFQKDATASTPEWIKTEKLRAESANRDINYIICNNLETLLYLNNLGCIELNPWNSRLGKLDYPDYLVIDLDPSDNNTFEDVIETALITHEVLNKAAVPSYCKTSGASGLHIYIPLGAQYKYDEVRLFAELIATFTEAELPKLTTTERALNMRKGRLYIDYLQNKKGQTLASAYSIRPKPGATVSTPLAWNEVKRGLHPSDFNIFNTPARFQKKGDLFAGVLSETINLKKALKNLNA